MELPPCLKEEPIRWAGLFTGAIDGFLKNERLGFVREEEDLRGFIGEEASRGGVFLL